MTQTLPPTADIESVNLPYYYTVGGQYREEMLANLDRAGPIQQIEQCLAEWRANPTEDNGWRWWWARHWHTHPYARATSN